jgi:hypothetical protein
MNEPNDVDDAIDVAVRRTKDAQDHVKRATDANTIAPEGVVDEVVNRADDLDHLTRQAAGHEPDLEGNGGR